MGGTTGRLSNLPKLTELLGAFSLKLTSMLHRDKRLLILSTMLLCIAGFASLRSLPNSEDPALVQRYGAVTTRLPGATAERVDTLITARIEDALLSVDEVGTVSASSQAGLSMILVELEEWVGAGSVDEAWTRVRAKVEEVRPLLPADATIPLVEDDTAGADTMIVAVVWQADEEPLPGILHRYAKELDDVLRLVPGTEKTVVYGEAAEEIHVTIDPDTLGALGLTTVDLARTIARRDSREPAGRLQNPSAELSIEVEGAIDHLDRLAELPVVTGTDSQSVRLQDIATITKGIADPPRELALINGRRGITIGARMQGSGRTEQWTQIVLERLNTFEQRLPSSLELQIVFQQSEYTIERLQSLGASLLLAVILVVAVNFVLMGWRSSLIVSLSIPATILFSLILMNLLGVAIHQMSVIGFIVALGMLIDNAIIMVDEIRQRSTEEQAAGDPVQGSIRRLAVPLLASTLTSVLAFMPIALMPGPSGEFMRAMAITVICCLVASWVLAVTLVPALMGSLQQRTTRTGGDRFLYRGISAGPLRDAYRALLTWGYRHPLPLMGLVVLLSGVGVVLGLQQDQELFPMSDRDQFLLDIELPQTASLNATTATARQISETMLKHPEVREVHWFVGTGVPVFYYNLAGSTATAVNTAQALVAVHDPAQIVTTIQEIQRTLDRSFPACQSIAQQLAQGEMPIAPIELSIKGPDLTQLSELSQQLRRQLSAVPNVVHTRSTVKDGQTKLMLEINETLAFRTQLSNDDIAAWLAGAVEGTVGGSLMEDTEELPIRVRFSRSDRETVDDLRSVELMPAATDDSMSADPQWLPLDAIADFRLVPELSEINRLDGERSASVHGYLVAGVLPSTVFNDFEDDLNQFISDLPPGYSVKIAGDAEQRGDAVISLLAYMGVIMTIMLSVLVISLKSFRGTAIIIAVAVVSIGYGLGALWLGQFNFGFSAILGVVGLIGVSINDSIVVLTGIMEDEKASQGDLAAVQDVVMKATRHVLATSITTMAGFIPLMYGASNIWPPMAVVIGFGVAGATVIALFFTPAAFLIRKRVEAAEAPDSNQPAAEVAAV